MNVHERIFALSPDLSGVWAITPEAMTAFVDALAGVAEAGHPAAAASGDAAAANAAPYVMNGPVAIIPVKGAMSKNGLEFWGIQWLTSMRAIGAAIMQAAADPNVSAIMLDVESPGGTVDGVEELAAAVAAASLAKPVFAYADGLMASAAYWASCAAREIAASATSRVGSIGVVLMHREYSRALDQSGITVNILSAGHFKTAGNTAQPLSDEMRAYMQSGIDDVYEMFLAAVAHGRGASREQALAMADGKIFLAGAAQTVGLIDRVCSRADFINHIQETCSMKLADLKAQHPEAVEALREELRSAVTAEQAAAHEQALAAARADTAAERDRVVALVGALFGAEAKEKLSTVVASGVSAEVLATLSGVLAPSGNVSSEGKSPQADMLAALQAAHANPVNADAPGKQHKSPLVADAERRAQQGI